MKPQGTDEGRAVALEQELVEVRARLAEAEATLDAIRQDRVDALVVSGPQGEEIRTILTMGTLADSMFNQVSQPVFIVDASNRILRANRLAHVLCDCNPEMAPFAEVLRLRPSGVDAGTRGEPLPHDWVTEGTRLEALEVALVRPTGETLYFLLDAKPIPAPIEGFRGGIVTMMDITRRKVAEVQVAVRSEQLRYQLRLTRSITDHAADGLVLLDTDERIQFINRSATRMLGVGDAALLGRRVRDAIRLVPFDDLRAEVARWPFEAVSARRAVQQWRAALPGDGGPRAFVQCSLSPVVEEGVVTGGVLVMSDISQQIAAEKALIESIEKQRHLQKMEAIDRLAGGVAHDFNNLLLAMMGFADLAQTSLEGGHPAREHLDEILRAGRRAASLTSQLLAYSRQQVLVRRVTRIDLAVTKARPLLETIVGRGVHVSVEESREPVWARIDEAQLQRVLVNLAMNAADAMPEGGTLAIRTASRQLAEADPAGLPEGLKKEGEEGVPAGEYATIDVRDTGRGMSDDVKSRLFEPFFTTKKFGTSAGLGLPTAYGIIKQMDGFVQVFSEPGRGSLFRIVFPRAAGEPVAAAREEPRASPSRPSGETILFAEDDEVVRRLLAGILRDHGYEVLEACDGADALERLAAHEGPLDLLVTDVVMERMGGRELATEVLRRRPGTAVVFVSGYDEAQALEGGAAIRNSRFLQKPFEPAELLATVDAALDRRDAGQRNGRSIGAAHPPR